MQRNHGFAGVCLACLMAGMLTGCRSTNWGVYQTPSQTVRPGELNNIPSNFMQDDRVRVNSGDRPQSTLPASGSSIQSKESSDGAIIAEAPAIRLASHQLPQSKNEQTAIANDTIKMDGPLVLPKELPGAETSQLSLPRTSPDGAPFDSAKQKENILKLYAPLPTLVLEPDALAENSNELLTLEELQAIARENHPALRAAAASVESARGLMIQAGLPPNPNFGYEADTVRTLNTPGYHGAYLQQTFITAQKLGLAAQAAAVDYANAGIAQRKACVTVQSAVRRSYFQVLGARKRIVLAKALTELTERAYQAQINLVMAGESAPYEPLQLRVLTIQARASLIRSQHDAIAAWRVLAATVAVPMLPSSALDGQIDSPVPEIAYEEALAQMTAVHTDLRTAENLIGKNRTLVTLADRVPIPDLDVGFVLQRDYTFTPGTNTYNLTVGGAVPVWNKNQGNRISARAELQRSIQVASDTENQLITKLAPAFGTYRANRELANSFRTEALSDQVRAYRGVYQRYLTEPSGVSFNDVIVAQQTVASVLNQYIDILQAQWQSTVDLGELLQVDDLFQMGSPTEVATIPSI